jgi:hypothetical protein
MSKNALDDNMVADVPANNLAGTLYEQAPKQMAKAIDDLEPKLALQMNIVRDFLKAIHQEAGIQGREAMEKSTQLAQVGVDELTQTVSYKAGEEHLAIKPTQASIVNVEQLVEAFYQQYFDQFLEQAKQKTTGLKVSHDDLATNIYEKASKDFLKAIERIQAVQISQEEVVSHIHDKARAGHDQAGLAPANKLQNTTGVVDNQTMVTMVIPQEALKQAINNIQPRLMRRAILAKIGLGTKTHIDVGQTLQQQGTATHASKVQHHSHSHTAEHPHHGTNHVDGHTHISGLSHAAQVKHDHMPHHKPGEKDQEKGR